MGWLLGWLACASPEAAPVVEVDARDADLRHLVHYVGELTHTAYVMPVGADAAFLSERFDIRASRPLTPAEVTVVLDVALAKAGYAKEPQGDLVLIVGAPSPAAPPPQLPGGVAVELRGTPHVTSPEPVSPRDLGVVANGDGTYVLDGAAVAAWLGDLDAVSAVARAAPAHDEQGALRGFRLAGMRRLSVLPALGLRNGMIVHDVDGRLLETPEQREEARQHVRRQAEARGQVVLSTVWRNEPQTLTYRFR